MKHIIIFFCEDSEIIIQSSCESVPAKCHNNKYKTVF